MEVTAGVQQSEMLVCTGRRLGTNLANLTKLYIQIFVTLLCANSKGNCTAYTEFSVKLNAVNPQQRHQYCEYADRLLPQW